VNNPTVNRFINERVRPLAEASRALYARGLDAANALPNSIAPLVVSGDISVNENGALTANNPAVVIDDGRAAEGVQPLTVGELVLLWNFLGGVLGSLTASAAVQQAIVKASVRPLDA
jgi:hypothetical protein